MIDTPCESSNDPLHDLAAEIRHTAPDTSGASRWHSEFDAALEKSREPAPSTRDALELGGLELGDGPFDPGPEPTAEECAQQVAYLGAQEAAQALAENKMHEVASQLDAQEAVQTSTAPASECPVKFDRPLSEEDLEYVAFLDDPLTTPEPERDREKIIRDLGGIWKEKQSREKQRNPRKSKLSPKQLAANEHRKTPEGKAAYNERQNEVRWKKAEDEGRVIKRRKSLKGMTPEEKAERQRGQAAERQRRRRANTLREEHKGNN